MAKLSSVKLSNDLLDDARKEAEALNRSLGAQVEHWARIGRVAERAPGIGVAEVRSMLEGAFKVEDLAPSTRAAFWAHMSSAFKSPDAEADAYYAELGAREGAVGRDEQGRRVRREGGRLRPIG